MLEAKLLMPFMRSLKNAFSTMLMTEMDFHHPIVSPPPDGEQYQFYGYFGMTGDVVGKMVVKMPQDVASALIEKMAGMPLEFGTLDFEDAAGELMNMIAGAAKGEFEGMKVKVNCDASVVAWSRPEELAIIETPAIMVPCSCDVGRFDVEWIVELD